MPQGVPLDVPGQDGLHTALIQVPGHLLQLWAVLLRRPGSKHHPENIPTHVDGPWSLDLRGDIDAPIGHQGGGQLRLEPSPRPIEIQDGDDDGVGVAQPLQSRDRLRQRVSLDTQQNHVRTA